MVVRQNRLKQQSRIIGLLGTFCAVAMPAWCQDTSSPATTGDKAPSQTQPTPDPKAAPADPSGGDAKPQPGPDASVSAPASSAAPTPVTPPPKSIRPADRPPPAGFAAAEKLYGARKFALAQKEYEKFISAGVADVKTHSELAYCLYYQRKYSKALKEFDWVGKNAKLISMQRSAQTTAHTIRCYMAGICPGNCLKARDPRWQHVAGNDPNELWIRFPYQGGWAAWSQGHIGEVIEYVNGKPQNLGKCPICNGSGEVEVLKDGMAPPQG